MTELTREKILSMEPGRELDALVAKHVKGCENAPSIFYSDLDITKSYYCIVGSPASEEVNVIEYIDGEWIQYSFNPSTDISAAWEVVERTGEKFSWQIQKEGYYWNEEGIWEVQCGGMGEMIKSRPVPEAICKAALLAVMGL